VQCEALVHASVGIDSDGDSGTVARSESGFDIEEDYEEAIVGDASGDDEDDSELEDNDTSDEDDTVASGQQQQRSVSPVIDTGSARGDPAAAAYIDSLSSSSGLHIMEEARTRRAYQDHGELGLFSLLPRYNSVEANGVFVRLAWDEGLGARASSGSNAILIQTTSSVWNRNLRELCLHVLHQDPAVPQRILSVTGRCVQWMKFDTASNALETRTAHCCREVMLPEESSLTPELTDSIERANAHGQLQPNVCIEFIVSRLRLST
jgi:hypothetical protein